MFSKEDEDDDDDENLWFTCIYTSCDIFIHAVTVTHVLHLDALRRQIDLGYNKCWTPIYTVLLVVTHTHTHT